MQLTYSSTHSYVARTAAVLSFAFLACAGFARANSTSTATPASDQVKASKRSQGPLTWLIWNLEQRFTPKPGHSNNSNITISPAGILLTFDAPGAGTQNFQGTFATAINLTGTIIGNYIDSNTVSHAFARIPLCPLDARGASFVSFDAPNAGTGQLQGTYASAISPTGVIVGSFDQQDWFGRGFVWYRDCRFGVCSDRFTAFDAPGVDHQPFHSTYPVGINSSGTIAGYYFDSNDNSHGFIRTTKCDAWREDLQCKIAFQTFDVPGGTAVSPTAMNEDGSVAGYFTDTNGNQSSFLRKSNGSIITFSAPNADSTIASGINAFGAIAGYENIPDPNNPFGDGYSFLRDPNGKLTTFDGNGEPSCGGGISASALNVLDFITGVCLDVNYNYHGFFRTPEGAISIFDIPNPSQNYGVQPVAINDLGIVIGSYVDINNAHHGFILHHL